MKYIFDEQDEEDVLKNLLYNQDLCERGARRAEEQGKPKLAASWARSVQRLSIRIMLLEGAFQHKN